MEDKLLQLFKGYESALDRQAQELNRIAEIDRQIADLTEQRADAKNELEGHVGDKRYLRKLLLEHLTAFADAP